MSAQDRQAVTQLIETYVEGLYFADSLILTSVFHEDLLYVNASQGAFVAHKLEPYLAEIDQRTSPFERGEKRQFKIEKIEFANDRMAIVWVSIRMMGRNYQDLLTVIATDRGWRIISKVFTYAELEK
ncbi:MAG: nuclear transport factor 2 family protein [Kordiimonadaceae bacterium]|nr:nuclear transport factor 2 family protein [Kordiimonadaceae bacterium]MBO6569777.1 nuclear transport factor 2 family protein [Kordiimonadaceae bacterium]MBO6966312.1 nuclear transport factor 2 family protein [Kordiimonadaceae bacterium]